MSVGAPNPPDHFAVVNKGKKFIEFQWRGEGEDKNRPKNIKEEDEDDIKYPIRVIKIVLITHFLNIHFVEKLLNIDHTIATARVTKIIIIHSWNHFVEHLTHSQ